MKFNPKFFSSKRDSQQVSELKHEIANRDTEIRRLELQLKRVSDRNREHEARIARIRQCAFGIIDLPEIKGGP